MFWSYRDFKEEQREAVHRSPSSPCWRSSASPRSSRGAGAAAQAAPAEHRPAHDQRHSQGRADPDGRERHLEQRPHVLRVPVAPLQRHRCSCVNVANGTQKTYTLVGADANHTMRSVSLRRTQTARAPLSRRVIHPVAPVSAGAVPRNTDRLGRSPGTPEVGQTLTADEGTWTGNPTSYSFQWQRCDADNIVACLNVAGATSKKAAPRYRRPGYRLRVRVTADNARRATTAGSATTAVISPALKITNHRPNVRDHLRAVRRSGGVRALPDLRRLVEEPVDHRHGLASGQALVHASVLDALRRPGPAASTHVTGTPVARFRGHGRYTVTSSARDKSGLTSAPARAHLFALARSGAAQLSAAPPLLSICCESESRLSRYSLRSASASRGRSSMRSRIAGLLSVVIMTGLVAVTAAARERSGPDIYNMHALVSDSASTTAAATDGSLVNGWGLRAGPTTPWWTSNNGTNTSTLYNGAGIKQALDGHRRRRPHRDRLQRQRARLRRQPERQERRGAIPLRDRGRDDPRLVAGGERHGAVVGVDRSSSGAVYKGLAIANDRLYATDFHNGRVDVFDASFHRHHHGRLRGPEGRQGLRAVRDPGARGQHLRDVREAGRRHEGRRPGSGSGVRRRVHARRPARRARRQQRQEERAAERAVGPRARAGRLQRLRRRPARRQLRQRPDQRVQGETAGSTRASCAANGQPISVDGLWAIAFGNGSQAGPTSTLYFLAGPTNESHGLFGSITVGSKLARWAGSRGLPAPERGSQDARSDVTTADRLGRLRARTFARWPR